MKRSTVVLGTSRRRAPIISSVLAVLLLPFHVQAQTTPAHDMTQMQSMQPMAPMQKAMLKRFIMPNKPRKVIPSQPLKDLV